MSNCPSHTVKIGECGWCKVTELEARLAQAEQSLDGVRQAYKAAQTDALLTLESMVKLETRTAALREGMRKLVLANSPCYDGTRDSLILPGDAKLEDEIYALLEG